MEIGIHDVPLEEFEKLMTENTNNDAYHIGTNHISVKLENVTITYWLKKELK